MMSAAYGWFVHGLIDTGEWADQGEALRERLAWVDGVEPGSRPRVHPLDRLGVLLSAVPLAEYAGPDLERKMEDMAWLEPRARAHAAVIAAAFELQAVLPFRFGTLFSSAEAMAAELAPQQSHFLAALSAARDQEEWTVRFCANPDRVAQQMAEESLEAAEGAGRGAQYLLRRRVALRGRSGVMEQLIARAAEGHRTLEAHALHSAAVRTEIAGLPGGDRSLLSRVYTIRRADRQRFLDELERVSARLAGSAISALHSGPWPSTLGHSPGE
jgi:hypothetical protein